MKIYEVVFKDNQNAYREILPCNNFKQLVNQWGGNGEIVYKKDITTNYTNYGMLTEEGMHLLYTTLINAGYGQDEIDVIVRTLRHVYNF